MEDLILIVDDARFARRIETKALQDAGFEHIVEAKTAKEALQIFEEQAPELTLLDITLLCFFYLVSQISICFI